MGAGFAPTPPRQDWVLHASHPADALTGAHGGGLRRMSQSATGGIGVPTNNGDTPNPVNAPEPAGLGNPQGRQARNPQRAPRA